MQCTFLVYLVNVVISHRSMSVLRAQRRLFPGIDVESFPLSLPMVKLAIPPFRGA